MAGKNTRRDRGNGTRLQDGYIVSWEPRRTGRAGQTRLRRFLRGSGRTVDREGFQGIGPRTVLVIGDDRFYFFRNFLESCDVAHVAWRATLAPPWKS